ncbi:MAG TPA: NYN domain-containing protein [Bryobacterales bacterium]|nr:NYN domain-containing protein [Bryobacterales bacterium]
MASICGYPPESEAETPTKIAVFIDYDNIEVGVKSTLGQDLDIARVIEGIQERGEIVAKIAYANWGPRASATRLLTEHGVQMVQRDPSPRGEKTGADINLALDALEMAFTRDHINTFAIVSGDSDFMSLVEKLKQYDKRVLVVGAKAFTSTILQRNCHEFISYESLLAGGPSRREEGTERSRQQHAERAEVLQLEHALPLLDRALKALERREVRAQLGLLKSTMLQFDPAFTERDYGVSMFTNFVQKLARAGYVRLHRHDGNFVVERVGELAETQPPAALTGEDAIPLLRSVLEANLRFISFGIPARELSALFHAAHPGFRPKDYGFTEFEELLNLAQDKALVRIEADAARGLRVFAGPALPGAPQAGIDAHVDVQEALLTAPMAVADISEHALAAEQEPAARTGPRQPTGAGRPRGSSRRSSRVRSRPRGAP